MNRFSPSIFKYSAFFSIAIVLTCITIANSQAQTGPGNKGRTVIQMTEDTQSTFTIKNILYKDNGLTGHSHVNVTTINGIVLLVGSVGNASEKKWVESVAEGRQNVRKVVNELKVEKARNVLEIGKDKLVQVSVKHRISSELKEYSPHIHTIVHRQFVYMMGVVTPEIAEMASEIARTTRNVERVIKIFEIKESES
jgi:osmotically-inducible protein OsmY